MIRRLVSIVFFVGFGLGLGLVVSEGLVRAAVPLSDFLWQWDPQIGMKLVPGKHGRSVKAGVYDVAVDVNKAGFRDRDHSLDITPGVCRVAVIGDSFVEALQVPVEDSVTAELERRWTASGTRAEVMNFGVSGASTAREYLTLRYYALPYKPRLVLLFFVMNDFGGNTLELKGASYLPYPKTAEADELIIGQDGQPSFFPFHDAQPRFPGLVDFTRNHFKTYRLLRETADNLPSFQDMWQSVLPRSTVRADAAGSTVDRSDFGPYEIYRSTLKSKWARAWKVTEQLLVAMRDLAAENHTQFAVVVVPSAFQVYPDRWQELLQSYQMESASMNPDLPSIRLSEFLVGQNVHVVSLLDDFRTHAQEPNNLYLRNDGHWTAAGHALAADLVIRQTKHAMKAPC